MRTGYTTLWAGRGTREAGCGGRGGWRGPRGRSPRSMTPEILTVGGTKALLDGDEDRGFLGARAAGHTADVFSRVRWSHLGQQQPGPVYLRDRRRQAQSWALGLAAGLRLPFLAPLI